MIYGLPCAIREAFGTLRQRCLKCHQWDIFIKRRGGGGEAFINIHVLVVQLFLLLVGC